MRFQGPNINGIWALKPYYLGPWTLKGVYRGVYRGIDLPSKQHNMDEKLGNSQASV